MSLLSEAMETCVMLDRITASDGYGGYTSTWVEGAPFKAAIAYNSSLEARIAERQGVKDLYTVTTEKSITLEYHDVIRRADGQVLRVTSDGKDNRTPRSAGLNMRNVSAEEWVIPNDANTGT